MKDYVWFIQILTRFYWGGWGWKRLMLACSRHWVGLDQGDRLGFGYVEQSFEILLKPNLDLHVVEFET